MERTRESFVQIESLAPHKTSGPLDRLFQRLKLGSGNEEGSEEGKSSNEEPPVPAQSTQPRSEPAVEDNVLLLAVDHGQTVREPSIASTLDEDAVQPDEVSVNRAPTVDINAAEKLEAEVADENVAKMSVEEDMAAAAAAAVMEDVAVTQRLQRNRFGGTMKLDADGHPADCEFLRSDCQGRRKALLVGCNYIGTENELKGCINDCHNMAEFIITHYNFDEENMLMLTDDQEDPAFWPTAECIIGGLHWLVHDAAPGDSLFFHFSGHGVSVVDEDGDEADGFDEAICPIDHKESGVIVDDMMHDLLVRPLQPGVRLTAVFDCCRSGTALDLPYIYRSDGEIHLCNESYKREAARAFVEVARGIKTKNVVYAVEQMLEGFKLLGKRGDNREAQRRTEVTKTSLADVVMLSGCRDDQTSVDVQEEEVANGALSTALIETLTEDKQQTYTQLLKNLRGKMKGRYTQIPQLSTGHPMDMNTTFIM